MAKGEQLLKELIPIIPGWGIEKNFSLFIFRPVPERPGGSVRGPLAALIG
jgi:hypothetical protein